MLAIALRNAYMAGKALPVGTREELAFSVEMQRSLIQLARQLVPFLLFAAFSEVYTSHLGDEKTLMHPCISVYLKVFAEEHLS